jgi:8-hydroxy-5-deazaflavin:NADPH oxidoreductase
MIRVAGLAGGGQVRDSTSGPGFARARTRRAVKIGVIGTGDMGRTFGLRWARGGHEVVFGSRDFAKAEAIAGRGSASARGGDFDDAAEFGDVVLYTVRDVLPSKLLRRPLALDGKILIDCRNSAILGYETPDPDGRPGIHFSTPIPSLAERLAEDAPGARVVKAFNTVASRVCDLGRETLAHHGVSVFLCGDDDAAKATVSRLAEELGFVGVNSGALERARLVEAVADFVRFQGVGMNLGALVTMSLRVLPGETHDAAGGG